MGRTAAGAAEEAAGRGETGLVAGGDRLLPRAGRSARPKSGPSPADRARPGSKHHVLTDGQGIPLAVSLTGGNRNDVTQLLPLLDKVPAVAGVVGRPRQPTRRAPRRPRLRPRHIPTPALDPRNPPSHR
ncbi:transposase [Streptomyces europaeiscabiei]|uniref:transposase n=1 Tax=Streptomyces europaeiscabiei TaxID=146819 RepID=UPI0038D4239C